MKPVKWGIISTANIGVAKVLPGMLKSKDIEIVAISSRRKKTAEEWAGKLGIPKAYGSYEEMLADPEIEAVYNPLPNHLHVPLTLAAAKAGKHVLCEKPIAITAKEAMQLKKIKNVFVAEAFMVRHATQWLAVRDLVKKKKIGDVRAIQVLFSYFNRDPKNVRNKADIGGGGLLDIGCYPITVSRFIFDGEPTRVVGTFDRDPKFGTDRHRRRPCRLRRGPAPVLHRLHPARPLSAGQHHGHQGADRDRDPLQRAARPAQPLFRAGHGDERGRMDLASGLRPVPAAGGGLRPGHPQEAEAVLGGGGRHPEHEDPRCLLPLRKEPESGKNPEVSERFSEAIDAAARPLYKPAIPMGREGGPSATGHGGPSSWKADQTHF